MSEKDQYQNIFDLIAQMDPASKPDPSVYELRLDTCRSCDQLMNGVCRMCGCFVEVRAAQRIRCCPAPHPRWGNC